MLTLRVTCIALFLGTLLSGCAALPDSSQIEDSSEIQAASGKQSVASLMQKAKLDLTKGKNENLAVMAPSYLAQANKSYEQALAAEKSADQEKTRRFAIQSSKYIQAGMGVKKTVSTTLKKALKHQQTLKALKAHEHYPEQQKLVDAGFKELVELIEQQKVNEARDKQEAIIKQMRQLEVKAVSYIHLSQAEEIYQQAMAMGAPQLAPATLKETDQILTTARQLISQNPKDKKRILKQAKASTFAAERLYHITRLVKRFAVAEETQVEALVLDQEKGLGRVQQALKVEDIRNLSFNDQTLVLEERGKEVHAIAKGELVKSGRKITQAELDKWRRKVVLLQSEVRRLQRAMDEK